MKTEAGVRHQWAKEGNGRRGGGTGKTGGEIGGPESSEDAIGFLP